VTRRGLGLAELVVGLALLGVVGMLVTSLVLAATRAAFRVRERAARTATLRTAALAVTRELEGLAVAEVRVAGDTLRYRARRGEGVACLVDGAGVTLALDGWRGWRRPQPGRDSLAVLARGTGTWEVAAITATATGFCPDGASGLVIAGSAPWTGPAPAPLRVLEWSELRAYESGGQWWLGARTLRAADVIQPLAGPLAVRGFSAALVAAGTADTAIEIRVRATPLATGVGRADSVVFRVPLASGVAP
jgi:hypothetical protein